MEQSQQLTMGKARKCFICYKAPALEMNNEKEAVETGQLFEIEENALLKSQLHVILLLRKFLEIPYDGCCNLLKNYGDPCSWIYWCPSCSILVKEAEITFQHMKVLEKKLEKLQRKIKATIIESEYLENSLVDRGGADAIQNRATEFVRAYVVQKAENFVNVGVEVKLEIASDEGEADHDFDNPIMSPMDNLSNCSNDNFQNEDNPSVDIPENVRKTPSSIRRSSRAPKLSRVKVESLENIEDWTKENGRPRRNQRKVMKIEDKIGFDADNSDKSSNEMGEDYDDYGGTDGEYKPKKKSNSPGKKSKGIKLEENDESSYLCISCGKNFSSIALLKSHEKSHQTENRHKCKYCNKKFRHNYEVQHHERKHTGERPYKCPLCPRAFTNPKLLRQHNRIHTGEKPFKCSFCEKAFPRKAEWRKHEMRHNGEKNHHCSHCSKEFSRADSLRKHEERFHSGETFLCPQCGKKFLTAAVLNIHIKRHEEWQPLHCEHCPKVFKDKREFKFHLRTHTGERPHECPQCSRKFSHPKTLRQHMKIHSGERPFECSECGRKFSRKGELHKHEMLHTGEKPHLCQTCGKSFRALNTLKLHQKVHSGLAKKPKSRNKNVVEIKEWPNAEGKKFKCSFCGKPFNHRNDFIKHTRSHTGEKPYPCTQCDRDFTVLANLRIHMRSHTGEQPYECELCNKKFSCFSSLHKHKQVHSTERPFGCSLCDKRFRQKHGLQKHEMSHTVAAAPAPAVQEPSVVENIETDVKIVNSQEDHVELMEYVENTIEFKTPDMLMVELQQ